MKMFKCDKCGREDNFLYITEGARGFPTGWEIIIRNEEESLDSDSYVKDEVVDLCPECSHELRKIGDEARRRVMETWLDTITLEGG